MLQQVPAVLFSSLYKNIEKGENFRGEIRFCKDMQLSLYGYKISIKTKKRRSKGETVSETEGNASVRCVLASRRRRMSCSLELIRYYSITSTQMLQDLWVWFCLFFVLFVREGRGTRMTWGRRKASLFTLIRWRKACRSTRARKRLSQQKELWSVCVSDNMRARVRINLLTVTSDKLFFLEGLARGCQHLICGREKVLTTSSIGRGQVEHVLSVVGEVEV